MDWTQVLTIVGSNVVLALMGLGTTITLFLWARSEAREDQQEIREDMKNFREIWMEESKDFHKRLCEIEAKRSK